MRHASHARRPDTSGLLRPEVWQVAPPDDVLDWLRRHEPVARIEHPTPGSPPVWLVTRHDDLVAVSRDTRTFSSRGGVVVLDELAPDQLEARRTMLEEDPPRHTQLRRLVQADLSPRAVRAYTAVIEHLTHLVLDEVGSRRRFDLVDTIAQQLPIRVIGQLLGVPDERIGALVRLGNRMVAGADDGAHDGETPTGDGGEVAPNDDHRLLPFGHPASLDAFAIADELAARHRARPRDDLTGRLLDGEVDGRALTPREFRTMWLLLVIAGNKTTRHAISLAVLALLQRPELWARWRDEPSLDPTAADELLRWTTPITWHRRTVTRDVELRGRRLRPGDMLLLSFRAANRDETVFHAPTELDLARAPNPHVTFGRGGPHVCVGAHLARLEVRIVFRTLFSRVRDLRLAGDPVGLRSDHFHGLARLPVEATIDPAAATPRRA